MTKRLPTTLALILLLAINCLGQNGVSTRVDEYVRAEMKAQRIPGVSLAVIKDGQIVLAKGYGFANVEHQVPVKPETIFQSGSMGEQFTATAVMMLMEDGKLARDDKIGKQEFKARILRYLDDKFTVVLFANQTRTNQSKVAQGVAALFQPEFAQ